MSEAKRYRLSVATDRRGFVPDEFILAEVGETNPARIWHLTGDWAWVVSLAEKMIQRAQRYGYLR